MIGAAELRRILDDRPTENVVDGVVELVGVRVENVDLSACDIEDVAFIDCHLTGTSFAGSMLRSVRFDRSALHRVSFDRARLVDCYFQYAELVACDLRRVVASRTSFDRAVLRTCDLYRFQALDDVGLGRASLIAPSLHRADLSGSDLRLESIVGGLAHESATTLAVLHDSSGELEHDSAKRIDAEAERLDDAVDTYRALSGLFAERGRYSDSGGAYLRAKQLERAQAWRATRRGPWAGRVRAAMAASLSWVADAVCGYGERLWRVVATMLVLALSQGLVLAASDGVERRGVPAGFGESFAVSFLGLVGREPPETEIVTTFAQLVAATGTGLGIALIGLFGFVLGNKIRFS